MGLSTGATRADRPGLGRGRARHGQGRRRHDARGRRCCSSISIALIGGLFSRQLMIALATPPDILDAGQRLCPHHAAHACRSSFIFLLMTAMMRGVGDTRDAAAGAGVVDGDRAGRDASADPRLVRPAAAGVASAAWAAATANALTLIALAAYLLRQRNMRWHRTPHFCAICGSTAAAADKFCGIGHPERARHGGDVARRAGAARPRQRLRLRTPPPPMARSTR